VTPTSSTKWGAVIAVSSAVGVLVAVGSFGVAIIGGILLGIAANGVTHSVGAVLLNTGILGVGCGVVLLGFAVTVGAMAYRHIGNPSVHRYSTRQCKPLTPTRQRGTYDWEAAQRQSSRFVDTMVNYLLLRAAALFPTEAARERWAEEWADHRAHLRGLRLLWWALCTRATASRTAAELRRARLPRPDR